MRAYSGAIVSDMPENEKPQPHDIDEPVNIELDPELTLRALAHLDPDAPVAQDEPAKDQGDALGG